MIQTAAFSIIKTIFICYQDKQLNEITNTDQMLISHTNSRNLYAIFKTQCITKPTRITSYCATFYFILHNQFSCLISNFSELSKNYKYSCVKQSGQMWLSCIYEHAGGQLITWACTRLHAMYSLRILK